MPEVYNKWSTDLVREEMRAKAAERVAKNEERKVAEKADINERISSAKAKREESARQRAAQKQEAQAAEMRKIQEKIAADKAKRAASAEQQRVAAAEAAPAFVT